MVAIGLLGGPRSLRSTPSLRLSVAFPGAPSGDSSHLIPQFSARQVSGPYSSDCLVGTCRIWPMGGIRIRTPKARERLLEGLGLAFGGAFSGGHREHGMISSIEYEFSGSRGRIVTSSMKTWDTAP